MGGIFKAIAPVAAKLADQCAAANGLLPSDGLKPTSLVGGTRVLVADGVPPA